MRLLVQLTAFLATCLVASLSVAQDLSRPNIILFMADDMGLGDSSAYQDVAGNSDEQQLHTPNMERLARMGVRFTDAHTPTSRCTGTRYGLLTGRYPWRNRMKHWVLFGSQGDPMIESDRPTLASFLGTQGYHAGMVGKWHVGLRYRNTAGNAAAGWEDADLTQPLFVSPLDAGFDFARFTSRSHGTSGPDAGVSRDKRKNNGPGHVDGNTVLAATGNGKNLLGSGPNAYVLSKLGSRHYGNAMEFLKGHVGSPESRESPFFLYYPANSNHGPYTPDEAIAGKAVQGASRSKSGEPMSKRYDFIYENDVALGLLLDWLERTDDPRNLGAKLIANTIVLFTSDNGAEIKAKTATGPVRSNKGSAYEGGHWVPYIVSWPAGQVGDGDPKTAGASNSTRVGLIDTFATFAEITGGNLPKWTRGEKGAEDSVSVLKAWRGQTLSAQHPAFHNDHSEAKKDRAACAVRFDNPIVGGEVQSGRWKLFFDASLIRFGETKATELYNLAEDPRETVNLITDSKYAALISHLSQQAAFFRNVGGIRLAELESNQSILFTLSDLNLGQESAMAIQESGVTCTIKAISAQPDPKTVSLTSTKSGLGVSSGQQNWVDDGEALHISFDSDVVVEFCAIVAGDGVCGGFYRVNEGAPLAIYCVDADNDAQDQRGNLSDIGVLPAGAVLSLDSSPHLGVEASGAWTLASIRVRPLP